MGLLSDITSAIGGFFDIGANIYQAKYNKEMNQRDSDYQKALQQQIFEREDTAVQRRVEDLQAAGINPNLAAGSAASAGSVVSRSNTNDLNIGSTLDTISAINQIKLQSQEQKNKQVEYDILQNQASAANVNYALQNLDFLSKIGNDTSIRPFLTKDGDIRWEFIYDGNWINTKNTPYYKNYDSQVKYNENSNEYLSRELNWYTTNQIVDMLTAGIGAVAGGVNAGANMKRANNMLRR